MSASSSLPTLSSLPTPIDPLLFHIRPLTARKEVVRRLVPFGAVSFVAGSLAPYGLREGGRWEGAGVEEVDAKLDPEEAAGEALLSGETGAYSASGSVRAGPSGPASAVESGPGRPLMPQGLVSGGGGGVRDVGSALQDLRVLEGVGLGEMDGFGWDGEGLRVGFRREVGSGGVGKLGRMPVPLVGNERGGVVVWDAGEGEKAVDTVVEVTEVEGAVVGERPGKKGVRVVAMPIEGKNKTLVAKGEEVLGRRGRGEEGKGEEKGGEEKGGEEKGGEEGGEGVVVEGGDGEEEEESWELSGRNPGGMLERGLRLAHDEKVLAAASDRRRQLYMEENLKSAQEARDHFQASTAPASAPTTTSRTLTDVLESLGEEESRLSRITGWALPTPHHPPLHPPHPSHPPSHLPSSSPTSSSISSLSFHDSLSAGRSLRDIAEEDDLMAEEWEREGEEVEEESGGGGGGGGGGEVGEVGVVGEEEEEGEEEWNKEVQEALMVADDKMRRKQAGGEVVRQWAVVKELSVEELDAAEAKRGEAALEFPFTLDHFQRQAVHWLEEGENVFVAAHTSAGKTVVAEYAIALCERHGSRCVYCSPIKALSNQKFRDFKDRFEDVGLVTGDVSVNPEASCLIMTTEILRSMLYRGADLVRDIEWVIFDEVHYVNDAERGVVWEETIIMLPDHVHLIFLSATSPNTAEFSEWIGRTKRRPVHVISTSKRPVPLSHALWAHGRLFPLVEKAAPFSETQFRAAKAWAERKEDILDPKKKKPKKAGKPKPRERGGGGGGRAVGRPGGDRLQWTNLMRQLESEDLLPAIVFSFSKRLCDQVPTHVLSGLNLNDAREAHAAEHFLARSISRLSKRDRELPQVYRLRDMVRRGLGMHHGGVLPILKECVELLFSKGLVKVLFATETFAMGVNMPARTVIFNGIRKHDGESFRWLEPGEYTQMAGRAGRRGIDSVGLVLLPAWTDAVPEIGVLRQLLQGRPRALSSRFRLTFRMLLSLLRVEELSVTDVIRRSFSEFRTQRLLAGRDFSALLARGSARLAALDRKARSHPSTRCLALEEGLAPDARGEDGKFIQSFVAATAEAAEASQSLARAVLQDKRATSAALTPGRVLVVAPPPTPHPATQCFGSLSLLPAVLLQYLPDSSEIGILLLLPHNHPITPPPASPIPLWTTEVDKRRVVATSLPTSSILRISGTTIPIQLPKIAWEAAQGEKGVVEEEEEEEGGGREGGSKVEGLGLRKKTKGGEEDDWMSDFKPKRKGRKGRKEKGKEKEKERSIAMKFADKVALLTAAACASVERLPLRGGVGRREEEKGGVAVWRNVLPRLASLDPREVFRARDTSLDLMELGNQVRESEEFVASSPCSSCPRLSLQWTLEARRRRLRKQLRELRSRVSAEGLKLFPDLQQRLQVLRTLGYVSSGDEEDEGGVEGVLDAVVELKGRVACEIGATEELVLVEILFEGVLHPLRPEEVAALLSAFVCQERSDNEPSLPLRLQEAREFTCRVAEAVGGIQMEAGLDTIPREFVRKTLNFALAEVVLAWARGASFADAAALAPDVAEGAIVRTVTRLDECIRSVRNAARVIGDPGLFRKMEAASAAIRRDVIFAASLYLN